MARDTGENATMQVAGYGTKSVLVESVAHGMSVVSSDDSARNHRAFYTNKVTSGSFDLAMAFLSHASYQAWATWMMEYLRRLADGKLGPMRVKVPKFGFDKIGVPNASVPFGDTMGIVVYKTSMTFIGTSDPLDPSSYNETVSQFRNAGKDEEIAPYFYPAGTQKAAGEGGDNYDENYNFARDMKTAVAEFTNTQDIDQNPDSPYLEKPGIGTFTGTIRLPTGGE